MIQCYSGPGRLAALERWLPSSVTILDRLHCNTPNIANTAHSVICMIASHTYHSVPLNRYALLNVRMGQNVMWH